MWTYIYQVFKVQADWTLTDTEQSTIEVFTTLDGVTLVDPLIRWSPNEWSSVCREIPQCLPIRCSGRLVSLQNEHPLPHTANYSSLQFQEALFIGYIHLLTSIYSCSLGRGHFFSFVIFFIPTIGLLGRVISLSQDRYLHRKTQTRGIRTHDSSLRAGESGSRLAQADRIWDTPTLLCRVRRN
jgi:hypothetical protein